MQAEGRDDSNRNFVLGVCNGVLINGGEAFLHGALVMAPFLAGLGAPAWAIGLIPALRVGGWFLPQLLVAAKLAHRPLKLSVYRRASIVRVVALASLAALVLALGDRPALLVPATLAIMLVHSISGGVGAVPFAEVTAKVVPHARLGTFWVLRNVIGGVVALLAGVVLRRLLGSGLPFPTDFGLVFLLGVLLTGGAYLSFALVREPAGMVAVRQSLGGTLRRLPGVLRSDAAFRSFLRVRFLALAGLLAEPFYAVYAIERLGAPVEALGTYVIVATVASIAFNFAFRLPADRGRNVTVLQASIGLLVAAPLLALTVGDWRVFALVFACSAAGNSGVSIAAWNLLYAVSPEPERPLYVGVANSVLALPSLAPVAAGALLAMVGYAGALAAAAALAATSLALTFRLAGLRELDRAALEGRRR